HCKSTTAEKIVREMPPRTGRPVAGMIPTIHLDGPPNSTKRITHCLCQIGILEARVELLIPSEHQRAGRSGEMRYTKRKRCPSKNPKPLFVDRMEALP